MVKIVDESFDIFCSELKKMKLILFGAGIRARRAERILTNVVPHVIVDNNEKIHHTTISWNGEKVEIIGVNELACSIKHVEEYIVLITSAFHASEIIKQLDEIAVFDGIRCYIYNLLADRLIERNFSFPQGPNLIPKKIHYCWFGKNDMPDIFKRYVEGWKEKCPDYEFILWNENNYDISKNKYMKQAYDCGKYGFVPDFARLDIVYEEGGIYLDVDIELIDNLSDLLKSKMFCCFINEFTISFGAGFGAEKNNPLIGKLRDYYKDVEFVDSNGIMHLEPCTEYQDPVLEEFGFTFLSEYQDIEGHIVFPAGVIVARDGSDLQPIRSYSKGIHYGSGSWAGSNAILARKDFKHLIKERI